MIDKLKGWRTISVNVLAALPLIADMLVAFAAEGGRELIPPAWLPYYGVALVIANVYLRTITTTPVGHRD